jgi:hypothetical protein
MPKTFYYLKNFEGGLVDAFNPRDLNNNELSAAQNVILDERKTIRTLGGDATHDDINASHAAKITGGAGVFVFGSDHLKGAAANDYGENWLAICDAPNSAIDLFDLSSGAFTVDAIDLGTPQNVTVNSSSNNVTIANSTNTSTATAASSASFDDTIKPGDIVHIAGFSGGLVTSNLNGAFVNSVSDTVITFNKTFPAVGTQSSGNVIFTVLTKAIYYFVDEALRVSDASFSTGTKNKWYGYIKRKHFQDLTPGGSADSYDNWFSNDNDLAAPTEGASSATSNLVGTGYPEAGYGYNINVSSADTGTWDGSEYQIGVSHIYDGNQESLLYVPTANNTITPTANQNLTINLLATSPFDERKTGGRIYIKKTGTDYPWSLLVDIDLTRGARTKMDSDYKAWVINSGAQVKVLALELDGENVETYEILNGYTPDEFANSIGGSGEGYKTAVIANRRCFVANVKLTNAEDKGTTTIQMRDRIMYTPVGRFDTFPRSFFIDVVQGDPEEWIHLEGFGDRLLGFKQRKLYILNVSSPTSGGWFLEDVKDFAGVQHSAAVVKTEFGVMWANANGCYLYDGRGVRNLILNKIKETSWENFIKPTSIMGYVPKQYYAYVLKDCFADDGDAYVYDFRTGAWVSGQSVFADDYNRSNNVVDWNNNMVSVYQSKNDAAEYWENIGDKFNSMTDDWEQLDSSTPPVNVKQWGDDAVGKNVNTIDIKTKDIDFEEPAYTKRLYSVLCTYKSSSPQTNPILYATDGGTTFTALTGDFSRTSDWKTLRATLARPVNCQSVRLQVTNSTNVGTLEVNDISLEFRPVKKRIATS